MKAINLLPIILLSLQLIKAQSSVVYEVGTTIEVTTGADICADNVMIQGTYTGAGTLCNGPLPVELTLFTAALVKNEINLFWKTETEVDNYGFNIERQINGKEWNTITFIEGHGNSNSPKVYSYSDKDLFTGGSNFRYRLKQIDTDGNFDYSEIIEVEVVPIEYELSQNYPNPFNPSTTIRFSLPQQTQLKINLYNMLGEIVTTLAEGIYEAGYHKVILNGFNLSSGTYVYRLESNNFVQVKKMILIK